MGLIMSGLGGMAEAGLNILQDERKNDAQSERDTRLATLQEELVAKRAQTVADIQEKARAAKEMRQADQYDQIDTQAAQNGLQRDATSMTRGAAGLPSEGEFAGQAVKPEDIANLPPAARLAYERSGLINRPSSSRLTMDKVDAARSIGADAEVRKELRDQYGTEVKDERIAAEKNSTLEETRRHNQATEVNGALTAGAAVTRAGAAVTAAGSQQAKPLNDAQSKALLFGSRMRESDKVLDQLASDGTAVSIPGSQGMFGSAINAVSPEKNQMLDQSKRDFLNAVLRRESGAVIADTEFDNGNKQYFPQVGDSAKTREQKSNNRKLAIDGILMEVPESSRDSLQPRTTSEKPKKSPSIAMPDIESEMRRRGLIK